MYDGTGVDPHLGTETKAGGLWMVLSRPLQEDSHMLEVVDMGFLVKHGKQ